MYGRETIADSIQTVNTEAICLHNPYLALHGKRFHAINILYFIQHVESMCLLVLYHLEAVYSASLLHKGKYVTGFSSLIL